MNEKLPDLFERIRVPPAPAELRARVLGSVEQVLNRRRRPRWERVFELASAASLLIGIGVTVWQWNADQSWQARAHELPVAQGPGNADDERAPSLAQGPAGWLVYAPDLNFSDVGESRPRKRGT